MQQFEGKAQFDVHWWVDSTTYAAAWQPQVHMIDEPIGLVCMRAARSGAYGTLCMLSQCDRQQTRLWKAPEQQPVSCCQ
jgi:hypothetical protein